MSDLPPLPANAPPPNVGGEAQEQPRKRGRPALPRDSSGNIIRQGESKQAVPAKTKEPSKLANTNPAFMSDEEVGKALAGVFMLLALPGGAHWRLFPDEEVELGRCFGPLARMYGTEQVGKWLLLAMTVPTAGQILLPRFMIQKMKMDGAIEGGQEREVLLQMRGLMEAEKQLDLEKTVAEARTLHSTGVNEGGERLRNVVAASVAIHANQAK